MKKNNQLFLFILCFISSILSAQRGYYDAPYQRYEADLGLLSNGATTTTKSYSQIELQSEASGQQCVSMPSTNASIEWNLNQATDGLVIRFSVPEGQSSTLGLYINNIRVTGLNLTSTWSWEYLWNNGNSNNVGVTNQNPKMRFDEIRYKLPTQIPLNGTLKLVLESGVAAIDFIELEQIPVALSTPAGAIVYTGNGSNLQQFIDSHGGTTIFLPTGVYNVNRELYFGVQNTSLSGAGIWYTQINFTNTTSLNGGLRANAVGISFSDLYLTTACSSRSNSYKAINGVFTSTSIITNIWAEHFECGAWIAQYNSLGPTIADGFTISHCRFRNNYADGINLCKGTSNAIIEHCNFRNNGDDDQAIWSANGLECVNNTFRFNTSENCWRAAGLAIYGGKNNKAYNLIIKDNIEAGIRICNAFSGVGFNALGQHEIHDITISSAGTFNDLYKQAVGAIDIFCSNAAGTQVKNIKMFNIDIIDSKNDALFIQKKSGDGIYNLSFENINSNGTGKEYPFNNNLNSTTSRGTFVKFLNAPAGNATYCNMTYSNRGGNTTVNENTNGIGAFSWSQALVCTPLQLYNFDSEKKIFFSNPVYNELTLENLTIGTQIKIYNTNSQLIYDKKSSSKNETINTSDFPNGIYLLKFDINNSIQTTKFIKN